MLLTILHHGNTCFLLPIPYPLEPAPDSPLIIGYAPSMDGMEAQYTFQSIMGHGLISTLQRPMDQVGMTTRYNTTASAL